MSTPDWMPGTRLGKYEMVSAKTVPYLGKNLVRFGMVAGSATEEWYKEEFLNKAYNPFVTIYVQWADAERCTPIVKVKMDEAEKVFVPYFRELYHMLKGNPLVTDADLVAMGFPKRPTGERTPSEIEKWPPDFEILNIADHHIQIDYFPSKESGGGKGRPHGQLGVEVRWEFAEKKPADVETEMHNSVFCTASPCILGFSGENRGRLVYIALRWGTTRGKGGYRSDIKDATIT
jgi:hypothetical protein